MMNRKRAIEIIREAGLALSACNNTVTTDDVNAEPKEDYSWRIDNKKEIALLGELEKAINTDTCRVCENCNKFLLKRRKSSL